MLMEFLSRMNGGELIGFTAVFLGGVIAAVAIVASQWRLVKVAEQEALLKRELAGQGRSAEEIERIVSARPPTDAERWCAVMKKG